MTLGYEAGDKVYIFMRHGFRTGVVEKVTASGQITVAVGSARYRFTARGREIGASDWGADYLERKPKQDSRAAFMREEIRNTKRAREYTQAVDDIRKIEVRFADEVPKAIAALRELADKLEEAALARTPAVTGDSHE
jgi:hypothetical protein